MQELVIHGDLTSKNPKPGPDEMKEAMSLTRIGLPVLLSANRGKY